MKQEVKDILDSLHKSSPAWFAALARPGLWRYPAHIALLDRALALAARGGLNKIIVNMPPRHGKSELVSRYFPAWYFCRMPEHNIILTTYNQEFASVLGGQVKRIIEEHGPAFFGKSIQSGSRSVRKFSLQSPDGFSYGGTLSCMGAGGPITGKGAHLLIIDDPVKNDAEAASLRHRDRLWDWFRSTAYTRLEPGGILVLIMTRWHDDDLCGRLLKSEKDRIVVPRNKNLNEMEIAPDSWLWLNIPAIAGSNCPLGRRQGQALWQSRYPLSSLKSIRTTIGSYAFSSLYQQEPLPEGSTIFRRAMFRYYRALNETYITSSKSYNSEERTRYAVMDLAATTRETSDYTVIMLFSVSYDRQIFIEDIVRDKFEAADHITLLTDIYTRYRPSIIGIESVQYQISLVQEALRRGLPVKRLKADRDKVSRALPIAARIEEGIVWFKQDASWLPDFEGELLHFPKGRHDDQIDCLAYVNEMILPVTDSGPVSAKRKRRPGTTLF